MKLNIKQQRQNALTYMNDHPWVKAGVHSITHSNPSEGQKGERSKFLRLIESHPELPPPSKDEWIKARELAKLYKIHGGGRPVTDLSDRVQGALMVWKKTGYVDYSTSNGSALWLCACKCNVGAFVRTGHSIMQGAYCCGEQNCPYRLALTPKQVLLRDDYLRRIELGLGHPDYPEDDEVQVIGLTVAERAYIRPAVVQSETLDDFDMIPIGTASQEIH